MIVGTIVSDPRPFYKVQGDADPAGCSFRVAINRCSKVGNNWETYTQFIELTCRNSIKAKDLLRSKWCAKGFHAYFLCDQSERMYTKKDGSEVRVPTFLLIDAHPILVSESYAQQKSVKVKQEQRKEAQELHKQVGAPVNQQAPLVTPQEEEDDIPF